MVTARVDRRAALLACVLLCACVDLAAVQADAERGTLQGARSAAPITLVPWQQLTGARVAASSTAGPMPRSGRSPGPLLRFLHPTSVALGAGQIYLVDAGLGHVFDVAFAGDVMSRVQGAPAQPGVRLSAGSDGSLYLADPLQRTVLRFGLDGRLLQNLSAPTSVLARPVDLAVDERRGLVLVVDASANQIVVMPLLGGAAYPLPTPAASRPTKFESVASGADGFYASDSLCRCISLYASDGRLLASFGQDSLRLPGPIAVDRDERVFVADRADNSIKVFSGGRQIASVPSARIGAMEITDLDAREGTVAVADGPGSRLLLLRVEAAQPAGGAQR